DEQVEQRAQRAYDEFRRTTERSDDLTALVAAAEAFLRDFAGTSPETEVRRCRELFMQRLDERDIQAARAYSATQPLNFQKRREHYQCYLEKHPSGGNFAREAQAAL